MHFKIQTVITLSWLLMSGVVNADPNVDFSETLQDKKNSQVVFQQKDLSCGAASLSMLFKNYLGEADSEDDIFAFVASNRGQQFDSVSFGDMKLYAEARGFDGLAQYLSYRDMVKLTKDKKVPFIVKIKTRDTNEQIPQEEAKNFYHFVVVRGASKDLLKISDPKAGNKQYSHDDFLDLVELNSEGKGEVFFIIPKKDSGRKVNKKYIDNPEYYDFEKGIPNHLRY